MDFTLYKQLCKKELHTFFDWLLPAHCLGCRQTLDSAEYPVCEACCVELPHLTHTCPQCGQAYTGGYDICGHCIAATPDFDRCFCPFEYAGPIKDLIIQLKYGEYPQLARKAAQLLASEVLACELQMPDLLVPVPMHRQRLRRRGFNQSALIAKHLGKILNLPVSHRLVNKSKLTPTQTGQSLSQRRLNPVGSFKVQKKCGAKSIAIVDDVVTTGSTTREIAKILKRKGVDYIQVWGVAHTL